MMKSLAGRLFVKCVVVAFVVLGVMAWSEHRAAFAYHELAVTISSVTSVRLYDRDFFSPRMSSNDLAYAKSVEFPVTMFVTAAGLAEFYHFRLWKGSPLVVLTLRDGSQRRARFSRYGGVFALEGVSGNYVVPGGQSSEFFKTFDHMLGELYKSKSD